MEKVYLIFWQGSESLELLYTHYHQGEAFKMFDKLVEHYKAKEVNMRYFRTSISFPFKGRSNVLKYYRYEKGWAIFTTSREIYLVEVDAPTEVEFK